MKLGAHDQEKVAEAIRAAESGTDGEIAVVSAPSSDSYHDAVLHWSLLLALLPLAIADAFPSLLVRSAELIEGGWSGAPSLRLMIGLLLVKTVIVFLIARFLLGLPAIRFHLVPAATKARRVRRRAIMLFQVGTERRTATRTGVLLYLSLAERRAEIVADESIHAKVPESEWGEAMAALLAGVRAGRPGDGIAAAVERIGAVLSAHFPHTGTDPNELPDRLIEL